MSEVPDYLKSIDIGLLESMSRIFTVYENSNTQEIRQRCRLLRNLGLCTEMTEKGQVTRHTYKLTNNGQQLYLSWRHELKTIEILGERKGV